MMVLLINFMPKYQYLYTALENIFKMASLPLEAVEHLNKLVTYINAAKGSFLIKQGQHTNHLYIIEKGFARIFSIIKGKEITSLFARENDVITSTYSLFTKNISNENVEVLEDSLLLKIDYLAFVDLCREHPHLFNLYRFLLEKYYLALEERTLSLQFDSALERYQKLLSRDPFILQRAPLAAIASYLGMSPVTLSRMRAQV
jgi:CRP-like cAMP-binding protein